ncbi:MAG: GDP-L-fucose synthase [SAR324 cluster bacterium]|nr:GDP-L-fucose synthase [SAR324 cluster bacterium]
MEKNSKIYIAGHKGLVGSNILRQLKKEGYSNLIVKTRAELELLDQSVVAAFFEAEKPEYVFLAAAKVGGIQANVTYKAQFLFENLSVQINVIHQAYLHGVKKLLFLGSSCIYPRNCPQPMKEEYLLTGELESTNDAYAIAKISGIKMCEVYHEQYACDFTSVMPTNLYGPNDNFDLASSHVLPAMLRKFHEAKNSGSAAVELWGTGTPMREFLHVDDMADACIFMMKKAGYQEMVNIGTGTDITIKDLALLIQEVVGFKGTLNFDPTKPDGTPKKLLDVSRLDKEGWKAKISLKEGIERTYQWFLNNQDNIRK